MICIIKQLDPKNFLFHLTPYGLTCVGVGYFNANNITETVSDVIAIGGEIVATSIIVNHRQTDTGASI